MRTIIDYPIALALLNRVVAGCILRREEKSPDPIADPSADLDCCTGVTAGRGAFGAGHDEDAMPDGNQRHVGGCSRQYGLLRARQWRFRAEGALQTRHGLLRNGGGASGLQR